MHLVINILSLKDYQDILVKMPRIVGNTSLKLETKVVSGKSLNYHTYEYVSDGKIKEVMIPSQGTLY